MIHFVPIIGELRKDATAAATACSKVLSLSLPPIIQSSSGLYYNLAASSDCFIGSSTRRSNPEAKQSWNIVEEIRVSQVSDKLKQLFWMKILIFRLRLWGISELYWFRCIIGSYSEFVLFQFSCQKYFNIRASLTKQRRENSILLLKKRKLATARCKQKLHHQRRKTFFNAFW